MIHLRKNVPVINSMFSSLKERTDINIYIGFVPENDPVFRKFSRQSSENYILDIKRESGISDINVTCSGEKSSFYAISDIYYREMAGNLRPGTYFCEPSFRKRGYIEGFYGKPWSYDQRLSFLALMASKRMNTVYYAPKDDAYHRSKWDILYPDEELRNLKKLSDDAAAYYIDFNWCIAPGLSIKYSDDFCFEKLIRKAGQIYSIGVRGFGLLLDDIDGGLCYEEDKAKYADLADAHIDLINRFFSAIKEMNPENHLTICPTVYHGKGTEDYVSRLGKGISRDISIFWTGRDICSRDITTTEAIRFLNSTGHMPLYWDNYPVNDCAMKNEMHMTSIINRDADLCRFSEGIISNCMEYCECSKIPLMTIADYLWNSFEYSPDESLAIALKKTFGDDAEKISVFTDYLHTSCLLDENTSRACTEFEKAAKLYAKKQFREAADIISDYADLINISAETIKKYDGISNELVTWLEKYNKIPRILDIFAEYILAPDDGKMLSIKQAIADYSNNPRRLTEDYYFESEINFVIGEDIL